MNEHTRNARSLSGQARRFSVPQGRMEPIRGRPAPLARPTQDAKVRSTQKQADGRITMPDELRKIVHGLLTLHGYMTPDRS